jgi:hypothetical protein
MQPKVTLINDLKLKEREIKNYNDTLQPSRQNV